MKYDRLIAATAGVALGFAAVAKVHELIKAGSVGFGVFTSAWSTAAALILELILAAWLLFGVYSNVCRWITFAVFAVYLGISVFHVANNDVSCGCFGVLAVRPWLVALFDGVMLVALYSFRAQPVYNEKRPKWPLFASASVFFAGAVAGVVFIGETVHPPILVAPEQVDFGVLGKGQKHKATVWFTNVSSVAVTIATFDTSCPCMSVALEKKTIGPGESKAVRLVLDMGLEPHFTGSLRIQVTGRLATGDIVVVFEALARVSGTSVVRSTEGDWGNSGAFVGHGAIIRVRGHEGLRLPVAPLFSARRTNSPVQAWAPRRLDSEAVVTSCAERSVLYPSAIFFPLAVHTWLIT